MTFKRELVGYYLEKGSNPTFDPGTKVNCMICDYVLNHPVQTTKTISVSCLGEDAIISFFYRVHKDCYEHSVPPVITALETQILDIRLCELADDMQDRVNKLEVLN